MSNDELSAIDALLARNQPLPVDLAKKLREQLSTNAAETVKLRKKLDDAQREARDNWCSDMDVR
jgi:hypothetical protein